MIHRTLTYLTIALLGGASLNIQADEAPPKKDAWTEPFEVEYADGLKLRLGLDNRTRFTKFDRAAIFPNDNGPKGHALEYMRMRTRIWTRIDLPYAMTLNARMVNRWHYFSSHFLDPNQQGAATWEFGDEIIFDDLNLKIAHIFDSPVSITLGRQALILGNGMIFLEGTPYDQGRTIYFDGVTARYTTDKNKLTLFAFWDDMKDEFWVIDDQNRRLRRGDTVTLGAYFTHNFCKALNTDIYYNFTEIEDDFLTKPERNHPADENASIHTYGARVFGSACEFADYSAELALQNGESQQRTAKSQMTGMMADLRLTLKAPEETLFKPSLLLEYTYMSGDEPGDDEFEGWHPLFAEYPIWREELLPILNNGNWTNLHQYRAEGKFKLMKKLAFTAAYTYLLADTDAQVSGQGGKGAHFGELLSAFLDYSYNENLCFSLESAFFFPGDYWDKGANSKWLRAQVMLKF